jgi:hypothetical protein
MIQDGIISTYNVCSSDTVITLLLGMSAVTQSANY